MDKLITFKEFSFVTFYNNCLYFADANNVD